VLLWWSRRWCNDYNIHLNLILIAVSRDRAEHSGWYTDGFDWAWRVQCRSALTRGNLIVRLDAPFWIAVPAGD